MYIAGFITDTHLSKNNLPLNLSVFEQAIDLCKEKKIPLFHGGDFLEERGRFQDYSVKTGFEEILNLFEQKQIKLFGIPGNHDKLSYTSEGSWISQFKHHPNLDLTESYNYNDIGGVRLHRIPFFEENGNFKEYLSKVELSTELKNVLLTHIAVTGVKNNDATKVENTLKVGDFKDFDLVLSGHYHEAQKIKNVVYFGSAFQANYGESNKKGITFLKEDGSLEFVKLDFPEFEKVKIDLNKQTSSDIDKLIKQHSKSETDNVRFEISGDEKLVKSIKKDKFNSFGIEVVTKVKEIEDNLEIEDNEIVTFNNTSILDEFDVFCEENELNKEDGLKILNKVL